MDEDASESKRAIKGDERDTSIYPNLDNYLR